MVIQALLAGAFTIFIMHIYLTRHGEDLNPEPGYLSEADVALSDVGKRQAAVCASKLLAILGADTQLQVITSPRHRTLQTAQIIGEALAPQVVSIYQDNRLEERDCAPYYGKAVSEVFSLSEPELVRGGMESYESVYTRLNSIYRELCASNSDVSTIIVTHSGNIKPLLQIANQTPPNPTAPVEELMPDGYIQLA